MLLENRFGSRISISILLFRYISLLHINGCCISSWIDFPLLECNTSTIPTNAIPVAGFHRSGSHVAVSLPLLLFYCRACLRIADSVFHSEFYTWRKSCRLHHWEMQFSESLNWLSCWFYQISKCRWSEIKRHPKRMHLYFICILSMCHWTSVI